MWGRGVLGPGTGHLSLFSLVWPPRPMTYVPVDPPGLRCAPSLKMDMSLLGFPGTGHCCFSPGSSPGLLPPRRGCCPGSVGQLGPDTVYMGSAVEVVILRDSIVIPLDQVHVHEPHVCINSLRYFQSHHVYQHAPGLDPPDWPHSGVCTHLLTAKYPHPSVPFTSKPGLLDFSSEDQIWVQCTIYQSQNRNSIIKFHSNRLLVLNWLLIH